MFKPVLFLAAATVAATMLVVPLASQSSTPDIVVSPRSTADFARAVGSDLDRQLSKLNVDYRWDQGGLVKLRFHAGADGSPTGILTYMSSGSRALDRKVTRAVARISSLDPLPLGVSEGTVIQANIIVAHSNQQMRELSAKLQQSEAERLASIDPRERAVLAISTMPRPRS